MPSTIPESYPAAQGGYTAPAGYSLHDNIATAQQYFSTHSTADSYVWFANQVRNKGPWDYKQAGPYQGLGNFNYGAVGTAVGIPPEVLQRLAGGAQVLAGTSNPEWGNPFGQPPYGDDPLDQEAINRGIDWAIENEDCMPRNLPDLDIPWTDIFPGPNFVTPLNQRLNTSYLASRTFAPKSDPLTLDLDGDGLETIGINPNAPILFDHNGDGVKTASGWVKPDDGFLVFDRNGNGSIDNGSELFGDSTALYSGGMAADGFAALAQEDTNGDGLVNAADAHWSSLRVWRDLNQDGISQSGELFTLESQEIAALKVAKTANSQLLANGNQIADLGGYIRTDGSERALGEVTGLAACRT